MTAAQLITWTLDNRPLDHVPGTNYDYSNFGYCILGRVIEEITGQTYEQAVKTLVLTPIGITDMTIGGNTFAQKLPKEVTYYGQYGEDPYAMNVSRMDSHGGWIATAADLARFLVYIDKFPVRPDILTPSLCIPAQLPTQLTDAAGVFQVTTIFIQGACPVPPQNRAGLITGLTLLF
jgi:CubicO group peptidase (beta-lactamase class C family)